MRLCSVYFVGPINEKQPGCSIHNVVELKVSEQHVFIYRFVGLYFVCISYDLLNMKFWYLCELFINNNRPTQMFNIPDTTDVNETLAYETETRPRPRPSCNSTRPRRDRDIWFCHDTRRDLARPRPSCFSRPSTFSIVPKQYSTPLLCYRLATYQK